MQFITITEDVNFKNPVYGEGVLIKGKTYYTFGEFARESVKLGFADIIEKDRPEVLYFRPSHLVSGQGPLKILLMFSVGLGDAVTLGIILPAVIRK